MKLQIDTSTKTIRLDQQVNLGELFELLEKLLPKGAWKEFAVETNSTIYYTNPISIAPWNPIEHPWTPNYPWITYTDGTGEYNFGVYNIEISN